MYFFLMSCLVHDVMVTRVLLVHLGSMIVSMFAWLWKQWCVRSHVSILYELLLRLQYFLLGNRTCIRRFEKNWEDPKKHLPCSHASKSQKSLHLAGGSLCRNWQLIWTPSSWASYPKHVAINWDQNPRHKWKTKVFWTNMKESIHFRETVWHIPWHSG